MFFSGHVQVAQVPGRNEPDSAGELNYGYLFNTLESHDYQGYIGCEYKPRGECSFYLSWNPFRKKKHVNNNLSSFQASQKMVLVGSIIAGRTASDEIK